MRAGNCTIQQALTSEAATIVKQAFNLARRRNHAQVTPLHVAISLLESSSGLLRKACLKSHSHPLQCKALELCFNVSLNRLPTSTSSPFLSSSHSSSSLSLSNALVAAFKRAQAHQRRGSIESQQQPILALKIEIEQLVISILDDPSVSRVMREAGFSSTQVKSNVDQAISFDFCPQSPPLISSSSTSISKNSIISPSLIQLGQPLAIKPINQVRERDVMSVLNALMRERERKRNNVIVGECLASAENVIRGVMDKLERGDVDGDLRFIQFINLPLLSFKNASKEEVELKVVDLKCIVRNYIAKGVVLYLGDLKWVTDFWSSCCEQKRSYYCPVQHMIMEIRRLVCGLFGDGGGKLWLMGIANFQTYMKCKAGHPSLESLWDLRPLSIPVGSLGLSLTIDSDLQAQPKSKVSSTDWSLSFEREAVSNARSIPNKSDYTTTTTTSMSSKLPAWLQHYKEENRTQNTDDHQENVHTGDLCKKWDLFFGSVHKQPHFSDKPFTSSNSSPTSPSISSYDQRNPKLNQTSDLSWPVIFESKSLPRKEHQFWMYEKDDEANPRMVIPEKSEPKPELLSNPNSSPNSATSSEAGEGTEDLPLFKEFNSENLTILCNALEKKVPWQKAIIPEIVNTVLQCRSGMAERKGNSKQREEGKEETWLFFLGADTEGKLRIARELARLVFGSLDNFISINSGSAFSSTRADSTDDFRNKRKRDDLAGSYLNRFAEALHENSHRVFYVEEVEQLDYSSQMGIKKAIENGSITLPSGDLVPLDDVIVIFSCESLSSMSRACSPPPIKQKCNDSEDKEEEDEDESERSLPISLDLNIAAGYDTANEHSVSDIGIKDSVDKQIMFKIQDL